MNITYFHRKVIPNFHFSVEIIFNDVRRYLPEEVSYSIQTSTFFSKGLFPRIYNGIEAFLRRGKINHVTGDINYVGLFLPTKNTIHTILDCVYMQEGGSVKKSIYSFFWIKIPAKRSRFVTTISEASKAEIIKFAKCNPEKIKVIPIALSPVFKKTDRSYQWEKPRVLMIGAAPNKNIRNILEALKGIPCKIQIVGKFNPDYENYMKENGMEYTYEWGLNIEQMYEKYKQTDILVFASTYEGFGMPIIEAQATGVAVVTSNISSMPEVGGEKGAVYVDPFSVSSIRDGIINIIMDNSLRNNLIENGFDNIKRFDPSTISKMYVNLYQQL